MRNGQLEARDFQGGREMNQGRLHKVLMVSVSVYFYKDLKQIFQNF